MSFDEISFVINSILCVLSFVLAAISVITVIVSLKQNGKLIKMSSEQLDEMRKEHELSIQPVLAFLNPTFVVEKPKLFFSPPEDEYLITSRYRFEIDVENISSVVAINIVCTGTALTHDEKCVCSMNSTSKRINILGDSIKNLGFMFLEQKRGIVFNSLREENVQLYPQGKLEVVFRNTSGGAFRMEKRYVIYPSEEQLNKIKTWHSIVASSEVDYKDELKTLRKKKNSNLFSRLQEEVDKKAGSEKEVIMECVEMEDYFIYESIPVEEYNRIVKECHFPRFVGRGERCIVKQREIEKSNNILKIDKY